MQHVMLDLETLGTTADAVIMSIGAVRFDLNSNKMDDAGFYASVSIESNLERGRRVDESTLIWWLKQSPAAQQVFHEPKETLEAALESLTEWFGDTASDTLVWSNGADFDIPMLAHAYRSLGWETPWRFWNSRCFRTYKNLPIARSIGKVDQGVKHNALDDAANQARYLQAIQAAMNKVKV